jgi:hypothetical protein
MELDDEGKPGRADPPEREGGKRAAVSVKDDLFGDIEFDLIDEEVDTEDTINDVFARDTAIPAAPEHLAAERAPPERAPDTMRPLADEDAEAHIPVAGSRSRNNLPVPPAPPMRPPQHTIEPPSEDLEFDSFEPPVDVFGQPIPGVDPAPFQPRAYGQSEMPTAPPVAPRELLDRAKRSMPVPEQRQRPAFLGETARHPPAEPPAEGRAQRPAFLGETARHAPAEAPVEPRGGGYSDPRAEPSDHRARRPAFLAETARHSATEAEILARATIPGTSNANRRAAQPPASEPSKDSALDFVDGFEPMLDSLAPSSGLQPPAPPSSPPRAGPREMQECYAVGDFSRALSIAEEILARTPDDGVARKCAQNCREVLTQMFAARIGPLDQVISVAISPQEVQWLALDHRAGFLLSLVDGQSTVDEILDISGMTRLDALKIIFDLTERHVVRLA